MSATEQTKTQETNQEATKETAENNSHHVNMESVNRIAKLPVVESTIQAATSLYEKAKDSNSMINWTLTTAESTVKTGVEKITPLAQPVASRLEGPIKKVDEMLCTGLDYVETKVPCVKLPPSEMLENTKNYINETVSPAVQTARIVVEPAMQGAVAVKDYGMQKVEELVKGKKAETTTDGRPRRVRPALLPSSFVSLVYMYVSLEELMQQQEAHSRSQHSSLSDYDPDEAQSSEKPAKK